MKKDLAQSKTENQKLKDENNFLNEKLNLCNALANDTVTQVNSFSGMYNIQVASCKGDRNSQTVTIELILTQNSTNQKLCVRNFESMGVDGLGNQLKLNTQNSIDYFSVYTNIPLRLQFTLKNVMPGTDMLSLLVLKMSTCLIDEANSKWDPTEIRNLKIVW